MARYDPVRIQLKCNLGAECPALQGAQPIVTGFQLQAEREAHDMLCATGTLTGTSSSGTGSTITYQRVRFHQNGEAS